MFKGKKNEKKDFQILYQSISNDILLVISWAVTRLLTSIDAHLLNFLSPVS